MPVTYSILGCAKQKTLQEPDKPIHLKFNQGTKLMNSISENTVNSEFIECIYHCDFLRMDINVRSIIVISGKSPFIYMY